MTPTTKGTPPQLEHLLPADLKDILQTDLAREIPRMAKDSQLAARMEALLPRIPTTHQVLNMDARLWEPTPSSVHLVLTSPPYWNLKDYPDIPGQLGRIQEYAPFLESLETVWEKCRTALVPGGRLVCVVGDVCLSRRKNKGRHSVTPLHASIQEQCRRIGFDNLTPILWYKIANATTEARNNQSSYLGKPYEPGGIIKNDVEFILMLRKPGGYRTPSHAQRIISLIPALEHSLWFRQVWQDIAGAPTRRQHPAPYPLKLAERLLRMFSFAGDTVLDTFTGTGTTQQAAKKWGRSSIGIDVDPGYCKLAEARLK